MSRSLHTVLGIILAALCGLCVWQWKREAEFRSALRDLSGRLDAETRAHGEARARIAVLEGEVQRVEKLRSDTEAKYLAAVEELRGLQVDWQARALTIDILSRAAAAGEASETQSALIAKQNEMLRKVAAERDDAIQKLNARTRELNSVTEKYNRLVKER